MPPNRSPPRILRACQHCPRALTRRSRFLHGGSNRRFIGVRAVGTQSEYPDRLFGIIPSHTHYNLPMSTSRLRLSSHFHSRGSSHAFGPVWETGNSTHRDDDRRLGWLPNTRAMCGICQSWHTKDLVNNGLLSNLLVCDPLSHRLGSRAEGAQPTHSAATPDLVASLCTPWCW